MNVQSTEAEIQVTPREMTLFDVLLIIKQNSRRIALITVTAGALAVGGTFLIRPKFTAEVVFMPPQQQSGLAGLLAGGALGNLSGVAGSLGLKTSGEQWASMVKSRTVEDALIQRFDLRTRYDEEFIFRARDKLESRTNVSLGKDGLVTVAVEDTDPKVSAQMAEAYVEELQKLSDNLAVTDAAQRRVFFERQLKQANEALAKAESALQAGGVNANLLKVSPEAAVGLVGQLKALEAAAQIKLEVLSRRVTKDAPEWRDAQQELEGLRTQLAAANANQGQTAGATGTGDDYIRRYRDFKYAETLFELMARQYELAKVDEAKEGSLIQIVDHAVVPEWKSSPKRAVIAIIVTLLAFAGAVIQLLVRVAMADAQHEREGLRRTLSALRQARWFR